MPGRLRRTTNRFLGILRSREEVADCPVAVEPLYPWYVQTNAAELRQGDILLKSPRPLIPASLSTDTPAASPARIEVEFVDTVILTQSCDLANAKVRHVLLAPHWALQDMQDAAPFLKSKDGRETLRRGNIPGLHLLDGCEGTVPSWGLRVVDFREVYSLPTAVVQRCAAEQSTRLRLLPPYREQLAQAFGRFIMRVGLPVDIPPFK